MSFIWSLQLQCSIKIDIAGQAYIRTNYFHEN